MNSILLCIPKYNAMRTSLLVEAWRCIWDYRAERRHRAGGEVAQQKCK